MIECLRKSSQHVINARVSSCKQTLLANVLFFSESAIGQYLLDNPTCAKNYSDKKSTILSFGRSSFHFIYHHLKNRLHQIMQAKFMPPKEFVYNLKLLRRSRVVMLFSHPIIFVQLYYKIN